jgi:hypothetical protein
MAQLSKFNLGKYSRVSPFLVPLGASVVYENIDNSAETLRPIPSSLTEPHNFGSNSSFYYFKGQWIAKPYNTDFVLFQDHLYFSDAVGVPQKTLDGVYFYNLGIEGPTNTLTTVYNGTLDPSHTKVLQYAYTYYNSADGAESSPSAYSVNLSYTTQDITISGLIASTDAQVTNIRLYRLGGAIAEMSLVVTLPNTTGSYTDTIADTAINGSIMTTYTVMQAPSGLSHLVEYSAMFFGAKDDKLYYTSIALVNNWSPFFYLDFDSTIIGLGSTQNGLLVFTSDKTYIITGTSPLGLSKSLLHGSQGCINHKTINYTDNNLAWMSADGLCTSSGSQVQVLSLQALGKLSYTPITAEIWDSQYFLFHTTGILVADFRYSSPIFKEYSIIANGAWYSSILDKLFYTDINGQLYSLFNGNSLLPLTYKSGKISDGSVTMLKNYKVFYVYVVGAIQLKLYIDDTLAITKQLVDGLNEVKPPQELRHGYSVQLEFYGTGEVIEVEYKAEGRQNGR